jgi:Arc/MetJ family transcription regulator
MPMKKITLTLEGDLLAEVREVAGARGLSSYVNRALRHRLQHDRLSDLLAELEAEEGPIEPEVMEEVRRAWRVSEEKASKRGSA